MPTAKQWQGLAERLRARQRELGLSQQEIVARSGVSAATLRKLGSGRPGNFRAQTLARVSEALEWPPGAIGTILDGGPPPSSRRRSIGPRKREAKLAALAAKLAPHELLAVEHLVEALVTGASRR